MALSLAGKTAIVTGAGSGINLAFARLLLAKKCNVIFADLALRPEARDLVSAHQSASRSPARAVFQKTDVRDWLQLERMFGVADREFGGVEVVCPGAGVYEPPWSNFWHPPGSHPSTDSVSNSRYALLDINLVHPIRTTQLALAHFLNPTTTSSRNKPPAHPSSPKQIIHISSIAAQTTPLPAPIYNASKAALSAFVRSLAPLEKIGVRVMAVAPGVIKTPLWTEHPEKSKWIEGGDEWVTPEYVAETMVEILEGGSVRVERGARGGRGGDADERSGGTEIAGMGMGMGMGMGTGRGSKEKDLNGRKAHEERLEGEIVTETITVEGGLILEVARGRVRLVDPFGDLGPRGREGTTAGGMARAVEEVLGRLRPGWGL